MFRQSDPGCFLTLSNVNIMIKGSKFILHACLLVMLATVVSVCACHQRDKRSLSQHGRHIAHLRPTLKTLYVLYLSKPILVWRSTTRSRVMKTVIVLYVISWYCMLGRRSGKHTHWWAHHWWRMLPDANYGWMKWLNYHNKMRCTVLYSYWPLSQTYDMS